ncbi:MAG: DUF1629 domain-containing protein [Pseudomonadota bacterium]
MVAYSLGPADLMRNGKVLHEDGFWPVDGNWKKVVVADMTDDGGTPIRESGVREGRWVDPTHAPTTVRYKGPAHQKPLDYNLFPRGANIVSRAFQAILEDLEPAVHQFLPVTVLRKDKPIGEMFILIVGARIDAANDALCSPPRGDRRTYALNTSPGWRCVLHPDKIAGHHLWHDKHRRGLYLSAALADALEAAKLEGYKLGMPIEVSAG